MGSVGRWDAAGSEGINVSTRCSLPQMHDRHYSHLEYNLIACSERGHADLEDMQI